MIAQLPAQRSLVRNARRARQELNPITSFSSVSAIEFPEDIIRYNGSSILVYDSGNGDNQRILVFSNDELLRVASRSLIFQVDGTFRICPNLFHQFYTIHCWDSGVCVPVFYALLPGASTAIYENLVRCLSEKINPQIKVIMDMEIAVRNAFQIIFPQCEIIFCFYHFCQAHWRKIQSFGLTNDYLEDLEFSRKVKMHSALAFMPLSMVDSAFDTLFDETSSDSRFDEFVQYFETQYIGRIGRNGEQLPPRIAPEHWNQYQIPKHSRQYFKDKQ